LLVIAAALAAWYWPSASAPSLPSPEAAAEPQAQPVPAPVPEPVAQEPVAPVVEPNLEFSALTFAEVYGTYSSDEPLRNFTAATALATSAYANQLRVQAASFPPPTPGAFYGVSTRALSVQVKSQSDSAATVLVKTQREEHLSRTGDTQVRYQDITLTLENSDTGWLVAGAKWAQ